MNQLRRSTVFWRGFLLGGFSLAALGVLWQFASQPAQAQIPDSGAQRARMIREMETTNKKLAEIVEVLKQIRDQNAAESPGRKPGQPAGRRP